MAKFIFWLASILILAPLVAAQQYTITDLGTFSGGAVSQGNSINDLGQIAGYARYANYNAHGIYWSESVGLQNLGAIPPQTDFSVAQAINFFGDVVGYSDYDEIQNQHAVLWTGGVLHDLGTLPGGTSSQANSINDNNDIAGWSNSATTGVHAVIWSRNGGIQDLGALAGGYSDGIGINLHRDVVGYAIAGDGSSVGFLWTSKAGMQQLPTLHGAYDNSANGINNLGQIAGGSGSYAVLWQNDKRHTLTSLGVISGQTWSSAFAINDIGQVVGWSGFRAFVWSQSNGIRDLNSQIPANSGWTLTAAYGINLVGQITGEGEINGEQHGFLLTPVQ
ncbi:MAG TPA: hypothetical protein VND65_07680 [Candidatus Binatia bacterium]|nr:hypothetical protein [Candidatus Binatia bacterium]